MRLRIPAWLLFFLGLGSLRAQVNVLVNGGFEQPVLSGLGGSRLSSVAPPTGWTVSTGQGVHIGVTSSTGITAVEGAQYYYIGDGGAHADISQSVGLNAGQQYQLQFSLSPLIGQNWVDANYDAIVDLTINNGTETFLPGLTYDFVVGVAAQNWVTQYYSFTPTTTANYTLAFTTLGGGNDAAAIDNVVLTAIPEAGSWTLAVGVIAGLVAIRRRWKRPSVLW